VRLKYICVKYNKNSCLKKVNHKKKKNPTQKRAGGVAEGVSPEFKPRTHQKNPKKNNY
jgi:hypothetical protein